MTNRLSRLPAALLLAAACCHAEDLYRVAGIVVNAVTGSPYPRARLAVLQTEGGRLEARLTTGVDGKFSFDLPRGTYTLRSGKSDDLQVYGRKTPGIAIGSSVITGPGQDNSNLTFRWFPVGAIGGRVTDEAGEPVENAIVQLVQSTVAAGRPLTATVGWHRTDDRGEYRFGRLPGGVYYLAVTGKPWYVEQTISPEADKSSVAYATVYYPSSPEPSRAAPLVLKPGEEARADFSMRAVPGSTVTVQIDSPNAVTGSVGLLTDGLGGANGFQRQERLRGRKTYTFLAVPPGHYQVRADGTSGAAPVTGQVAVEADGSAVSVKVQVKPYPAVTGTVQLKNPDARPKGTILASLVREDTGRMVSTAVQPGGGFAFAGVAPGKYRIAIGGTDRYFASEIHVDGATYSKGVLDLVEGGTVTIRMVASDELGRVHGFVMDGGQAMEGALVVLAPAGETNRWPAYEGFQTDSDGSYDFTQIPSGDYLIFAVEDCGFEYANPIAVRPYLSSAKPVRVEPHGSYSERIAPVKLAPGN
jgi:hypothetical protein